MSFIGDGFKNGDFMVGIICIIGVIILIVFGKFLMMGVLFIVGAVVALAIIGFMGKVVTTILALFGLYKEPEGGDKK